MDLREVFKTASGATAGMILADNFSLGKGAATVTYSCLQDGKWYDYDGYHEGEGNITIDPLFVNDLFGYNQDHRLTQESPCIDASNNAAIPAEVLTDLDGNFRIINAVVDRGAYEHQPADTDICELAQKGDINCDGIVDILDLAILAAHWLEGSE